VAWPIAPRGIRPRSSDAGGPHDASASALMSARPASIRSPVLLDTDANNEIDDQHAIAYLLANADRFDIRTNAIGPECSRDPAEALGPRILQ
jgi:hypothetical protein